MSARLPRRMRRGLLVLGGIGAALLAAFVTLADTPLPASWKHWHYSRAIELQTSSADRLTSISLPPEVFSRAQLYLPDVRVIDDRGAEIPYVLFLREGSKTTVSRATILHERSFAPGLYTQVVIEIGYQNLFHNAIEIQTPETDFIEWVQVEASDDARIWRIVQPRAPIFRFRKNSREGTQVVHYSENNAHFLRVRILDGDKQFPIAGANILYETAEAPERVLREASLNATAQPPAERSVWTADLGAMEEPISDVKFDVAGPAEFLRTVEVQASSDNKEWRTFARGEIYRYQQSDVLAEQLSVSIPFGGTQARYWQVQIVNHNDSPLSGVVPRLYSIPRHIVFEQQAGRTYRLLYGHSRAERPAYDLGRRMDAKQMAAAEAAALGPEEVNADWVDPRPWTETHDIFLWLVLFAAVMLLGYAALRSLQKSAAPEA